MRISAFRLYASLVHVETHGKIRVVKIGRPEVRNAVNKETALSLYNAFKEFDKDESVSVGILSGHGDHFCSGYDLKELAKSPIHDFSSKPFSMTEPGPMGPTRLLLSKPVIASLTGYVVAGGLELALWCDLRVAESNVTLGFMNRRFGVPLIDGGTVRLPALIGLSRALDLILTGRALSGEEALKIGLVNRLVPVGQGLQGALELANQIAAFPQATLRRDRASAIGCVGKDTAAGLCEEYVRGLEVIDEAVGGAKRFAKGFGRSGQLLELNKT